MTSAVLTRRFSRKVNSSAMARLSTIKMLAGFDFSFQPSLDKSRIMTLAELKFVDRAEVLLLIGPPESDSYCPSHYAVISSALLARIAKRRTPEAPRLRGLLDLGTLQIARLDHPRRAFAQLLRRQDLLVKIRRRIVDGLTFKVAALHPE